MEQPLIQASLNVFVCIAIRQLISVNTGLATGAQRPAASAPPPEDNRPMAPPAIGGRVNRSTFIVGDGRHGARCGWRPGDPRSGDPGKRSVKPVSGVTAVGQASSNSEPIRSGRPPCTGDIDRCWPSTAPASGWPGRMSIPGRVDDWRGGGRRKGVAVPGGFRQVPVPHSPPWLRFQSPLIKPDVRISRIRLSDEIMPSPTDGAPFTRQGA